MITGLNRLHKHCPGKKKLSKTCLSTGFAHINTTINISYLTPRTGRINLDEQLIHNKLS